MRRLLLALSVCVTACILTIVLFPRRVSAGDLMPIHLGLVQYQHAPEPFSDATDINDFGQVTGYTSDRAVNWSTATIWQPSSRLSTVGTLHEISAIAGYSYPYRYTTHINSRGQFFAFGQLFTPDVPNTLTGTFSEHEGSLPNSLGQYAGALNGTPARVDPDGTVVEVAPGGPGLSYAAFINDFGQVAGMSDDRWFVWTPSSPGGTTGQTVDLGLSPTIVMRSEIVALSPAGAVGVRIHPHAWIPGRPASYLWQPDSPNTSSGTLIDLDNLFSEPVVDLLDVNAAGQLLVNFLEEDGRWRGAYVMTPMAWAATSRSVWTTFR